MWKLQGTRASRRMTKRAQSSQAVAWGEGVLQRTCENKVRKEQVAALGVSRFLTDNAMPNVILFFVLAFFGTVKVLNASSI